MHCDDDINSDLNIPVIDQGDHITRPQTRWVARAWKTDLVQRIEVRQYKSYDDSVKLKRTEMDPFRLG